MRRKILTLLLAGLCASFLILSSVTGYFLSSMQSDLFRLEKEFSKETSEYVWTQAREQAMTAVKQLTLAHAAHIDLAMNDLKEDAKLISDSMSWIISNPHNYMPRDSNELKSEPCT